MFSKWLSAWGKDFLFSFGALLALPPLDGERTVGYEHQGLHLVDAREPAHLLLVFGQRLLLVPREARQAPNAKGGRKEGGRLPRCEWASWREGEWG